jgi:hypothetical protein
MLQPPTTGKTPFFAAICQSTVRHPVVSGRQFADRKLTMTVTGSRDKAAVERL